MLVQELLVGWAVMYLWGSYQFKFEQFFFNLKIRRKQYIFHQNHLNRTFYRFSRDFDLLDDLRKEGIVEISRQNIS